MPFSRVYLEITNCCNLACSFCPGTTRRAAFLTVAQFTHLAGALRGQTRFLYFHVMGEPLLHPELPELLDIAGRMGFRVVLTTNGTLLPKRQRELLAAPALHKVSVDLSRKIAGDGEGATKLLECKVTGGKTDEIAKKVAKSVICSSLTKAAMFGADANWGRVLCAIGYSGADVDIEKINVSFKSVKGTIEVCRNGAGVDFSEEKAKEILLENEIDILVDLNDGDFDATAWGCDLTYEYVKINGDYRT